MRRTTEQAVEGLLGPRPQRYLATDARLEIYGTTITGAETVAEVLRELTAGADVVRLELSGDDARAMWPIASGAGHPWIECCVHVSDGVVTTVSAARRA